MKLISLSEYVLRFDKPIGFYADQLDYYEGQSNAMSYVISYAKFLKQKLSLEMFVPCKLVNGVWVVLEEPEMYEWYNCEKTSKTPTEIELCKEYQEAKDRVLFEGFSVTKKTCNNGAFEYIENGEIYTFGRELTWQQNTIFSTIEDLVKYNLELTPTAEKQIGL